MRPAGCPPWCESEHPRIRAHLSPITNVGDVFMHIVESGTLAGPPRLLIQALGGRSPDLFLEAADAANLGTLFAVMGNDEMAGAITSTLAQLVEECDDGRDNNDEA